jgi:hypothetical protein
MSNRIYPKRLLVEGREEERVVPELIEKNGITWGDNKDSWIVKIDEFNGV